MVDLSVIIPASSPVILSEARTFVGLDKAVSSIMQPCFTKNTGTKKVKLEIKIVS